MRDCGVVSSYGLMVSLALNAATVADRDGKGGEPELGETGDHGYGVGGVMEEHGRLSGAPVHGNIGEQ